MTPEEKERLEACLQEISSILYQNTPSEEIETLEGIEITVREQTLAQISPKIALFFIEKQTKTQTPAKGRKRTIKSCVGSLKITKKQANRLGLAPYQLDWGTVELVQCPADAPTSLCLSQWTIGRVTQD